MEKQLINYLRFKCSTSTVMVISQLQQTLKQKEEVILNSKGVNMQSVWHSILVPTFYSFYHLIQYLLTVL